ncbi:hypothetical protein C8J57DRAFT_192405 [Mycena rebaudengoi]|nr:hypothetical protein C8J57DRAFT_192405 [Mycena rebaudengoi]
MRSVPFESCVRPLCLLLGVARAGARELRVASLLSLYRCRAFSGRSGQHSLRPHPLVFFHWPRSMQVMAEPCVTYASFAPLNLQNDCVLNTHPHPSISVSERVCVLLLTSGVG